MPNAPPTTASTTLSVSSWRRSRAATRAERETDRHLAMPRRRAREQHVRDVRAGDEQHEPDGAEQHQECRADVADDHGVERRDRHVAIRPGKRLLEVRR